MADINIRKDGQSGRITLNRPKALNALSYDMCLQIEAALDAWRDDDTVKIVIIDAAGDKAFCAGGDIQEMYDTGKAGDFEYGRKFWADEYRLNAKIAEYPKPYIAFMQGFTMGGGVGVSCHGSHRIVCENSQVAMPECGIGLVPDVGGSLLLARAPGHLGEYLGTTATRMGPGDAIYAGFADHYVSYARWPALIEQLTASGNAGLVRIFASSEIPLHAALKAIRPEIDAAFAADTLPEIIAHLQASNGDLAANALKSLNRCSPLSACVAVDLIRASREAGNIRAALDLEYRFTYRSAEHGDFIEGIRAAIIDKDRNPQWQHANIGDVNPEDIKKMLAPLGDKALNLQGE